MPIRSSYAQTIGQDRLPGQYQSINYSKMSVETVAIQYPEDFFRCNT